MKIHALPTRLVVGAYLLHTGLEKWKGDETMAKSIHHMATEAYPVFNDLAPTRFLKLLAAGEITVGLSLLLPIVSPAVAGALLTGFSGSLLGLYFRTPGLREESSIWPTSDGIAVSKDSWMLSIGLGLLIDACKRAPRKGKRNQRVA